MSAPATPAVRTQALTRSFGDGDESVQVLRGVDYQAGFGALNYLVGPSGCGKTTLLSIVAGLLEPGDGDLEVLGERPQRFGARARCGIGPIAIGGRSSCASVSASTSSYRKPAIAKLSGMRSAVTSSAGAAFAPGADDALAWSTCAMLDQSMADDASPIS